MSEAFLAVRPSNTAAIRLYLSLGFDQVGMRRRPDIAIGVAAQFFRSCRQADVLLVAQVSGDVFLGEAGDRKLGVIFFFFLCAVHDLPGSGYGTWLSNWIAVPVRT